MGTPTRTGWDRFQDILEQLKPGDEIHAAAASHETGLPQATCVHVLEALARVDLFTRTGEDVFLRQRLRDITEIAST